MSPPRSSKYRSRWVFVILAATVSIASAPNPTQPLGSPNDQVAFDRLVASAKNAMLGDPVKAREIGRSAGKLATTWPAGKERDVAIATARFIEGEGAYRANDVKAAVPLTSEALEIAERIVPGSKLNADLLLSRARLRREAGKPQDALSDLQHAYNIFVTLHDDRSRAKALQSIGTIYQDAQDYNRVLYYYKMAEELASSDLTLMLSANNNMANAYSNLGRWREAASAYRQSVRLAKKLKSPLLVARILENISDLATDSHDYEGAQNALVAGLKLTATPAAASWRPMLLGTRAKLALAEGRLADAQSDLGTAFAIARDVTTDQSYSSLHLTAYRVYKAANDPRRALEHLEIYRQIDQQGRNLAASTNAALMTARFDFANQNARIATLKAGQLSRDVALTRLRARQSTIFFSGLLTLLSTLLAFLFVYLRSIRRSRNDIMRANEQLARTNTELGEALQVKSQFLATTSHEIRTPLNGILGMTQVILADRAIGGVTRDRISLVDAAGRAMRTLVDDILDFAKMDSGTVRLDTTVTDLRTMIPNLVSLWKGQAEEKGIDLRLSLRDVEEPLVTDAARLRQVIFNLLSNAIKFTAEGAVTVDVRAEDEGQSRKIMIAVTDSGIGIAAEAHHSIFEPFRQLDTSTTRQFGGTGLGLAISRHLARVLGGDITVTSTPGHGATFTIRLPYPAFVAEQQSVTARTMVSILIVSDNSIRRSFLRTALEAEFGFTAACDATELVSFVNDNVVERVLVDIGDDQGKDAVDNILAAWIRRPSQPRLVLLLPAILTNYLSTWQTAGVSRVIVKPCRVDALIKMLRIDGGDESESPDAARDPVAIAPDVP